MTDLLTRLRDATEGNRELSVELWYEYVADKEKLWSLSGLNAQRPLHKESTLKQAVLESPLSYGWRPLDHNYTTSIDAALTLVPEGHGWAVSLSQDPGMDPPGFSSEWETAQVWQHPGNIAYSTHAKPALALCIAALKAQQSKAEVS